jgi:hypothetical protein
MEHVLRIPLKDRSWKIRQKGLFISFPGPEPKAPPPPQGEPVETIAIGGPEPVENICIAGPEPKTKDKGLTIELDSTLGKWHVKPNLTERALDISFGGPEEP